MFKRIFDVVASTLTLTVLLPILVAIAIAVKVTSAGPIFYQATRVGQYGHHFKLFKFRSMVINADKIGPAVTGASDPRITPVGRFLRRTKLDELPQFLNVIRGDMSIVGPRPEDPRYVAHYTEEQRQVLNVRPGITSPASIKYRNEESILSGDDWELLYVKYLMPEKVAIDLEYARSPSLLQDFKIILSTIKAVVS